MRDVFVEGALPELDPVISHEITDYGWRGLPRVPYIEGDLSTLPGFYLEDLLQETDVTVVAQLANNMQYILTGGTCKGGFENNTRDGQVRVRWEGVTCQEVSL